MKIAIHNLQRKSRINRIKLNRLLLFFGAKLSRMPVPNPDWKAPARYATVSLVLVDHAKTRKIKKEFWGLDDVTDVMTFHCTTPSAGGLQTCGDVIVNVEQALDNSYRQGGADRELALYIAHGIDHLLGYDDVTSQGQRRMRQRELIWLRQAEKKEMLSGLLPTRIAPSPLQTKSSL